MNNKNRCIDCQMFERMIAMANHVRKTSYCYIGKKSIYVRSGKSIACENFKPVKTLNKILE